MTEIEFQRSMSRIKACYPQSFNEEKIRIIYEKVCHISGEEFHKICEKLIVSLKHAPTVFDFIELIRVSSRYSDSRTRTDDPDHSIFTDNQRSFLFALTKKVSHRGIDNQNEFLEIFIPTLTEVIKSRNKPVIKNLFIETSALIGIPYSE